VISTWEVTFAEPPLGFCTNVDVDCLGEKKFRSEKFGDRYSSRTTTMRITTKNEIEPACDFFGVSIAQSRLYFQFAILVFVTEFGITSGGQPNKVDFSTKRTMENGFTIKGILV
jgi:hypothetical protein